MNKDTRVAIHTIDRSTGLEAMQYDGKLIVKQKNRRAYDDLVHVAENDKASVMTVNVNAAADVWIKELFQ